MSGTGPVTGERDHEQRAGDARLAWIIVTICAATTLVLLVVLGPILLGYATRTLEQDWQRHVEQEVSRRRASIPPDTARPIGDPALWLVKAAPPAEAIARGEHGTVRMTLAVGPDDVPTGCSVAESSGYPGLDNGTCQAMIWAGDFERVPPGKPGSGPGEVRRWTSPPIDWSKVK